MKLDDYPDEERRHPRTLDTRVISAVREGLQTSGDVAEKIGLGQWEVSPVLGRLYRQGDLDRVPRPTGRKGYLYFIKGQTPKIHSHRPMAVLVDEVCSLAEQIKKARARKSKKDRAQEIIRVAQEIVEKGGYDGKAG